ncbi:MAG: hypothetical protein ACKVTZ_17875 [Bacteroidia bacterium]
MLQKIRFFFLILTCFWGCIPKKDALLVDKEMVLRLRWASAYSNEKWEEVQTGLEWGLSLLGAELPKGCMKKALIAKENKIYELNFNELGFSETAKNALLPLLFTLKKSEEYQQKGGIDMGRFLVFTLHHSWHYYAITNVPRTFAQFEKTHRTPTESQFSLLHSSVSNGNRLISFQENVSPTEMAFVAKEVHEAKVSHKTETAGFEAFDIMKNGQLRFIIYDEKGKLAESSPVTLSKAGKPGKCMWCHESKILPLFVPSLDAEGSMSVAEFEEKMKKMNTQLGEYQLGQNTEIDWKNTQAHTRQEWLYIGFMEPNVRRIAAEWGMSEAQTLAKIQHLPTHRHEEFDFFGDCYHRKDIDVLAPFGVVKVPESVREGETVSR